VELRPYGDDDYGLTVALETDPAVMRELGGPLPADAIPAIHHRRLEAAAPGDRWFAIEPETGGPAAGAIGYWPGEWRGRAIHEAGWMLLPAFQGRGLARTALAELIRIAREDPPVGALDAFPGITNAASNALCRSAGFELLAEATEVEYAGRTLRCNHWRLLTPPPGVDGGHTGPRAESA
jgi:RimJ/RimL family protein N-acetyltransferase